MYRCVCASVYVSMCAYISVHKKWGCPLRVSSVNVTKSAVFCAVYVYICALSYRFVIKHHELTLQVNSYKWLVVIKTSTKKANRQINKQANKQTKNIHSGGRWNLISAAEETEQKCLYWNPQNGRTGHQLISPTTWVSLFSASKC